MAHQQVDGVLPDGSGAGANLVVAEGALEDFVQVFSGSNSILTVFKRHWIECQRAVRVSWGEVHELVATFRRYEGQELLAEEFSFWREDDDAARVLEVMGNDVLQERALAGAGSTYDVQMSLPPLQW